MGYADDATRAASPACSGFAVAARELCAPAAAAACANQHAAVRPPWATLRAHAQPARRIPTCEVPSENSTGAGSALLSKRRPERARASEAPAPKAHARESAGRTGRARAQVFLAPPRAFTLEDAIGYVAGDELIEVTPSSIRLRKRVLDLSARKTARRRGEGAVAAYG